MADFGIAYSSSGGSSFNIILAVFAESSIPRSYSNESGMVPGLAGATLLTGPTYSQKRIWSISAVVTKIIALELDSLFRAWDQDRSSGISAACGVVDRTFGPDVSANAIFSTAPTFDYVSDNFIVASFGLMEV